MVLDMAGGDKKMAQEMLEEYKLLLLGKTVKLLRASAL